MNHATASPVKKSLTQVLLSGLPTVLVLCVIGGGWMVMHHINSGGGHSTEEVAETTEDSPEVDVLVLPEGKLNAGNIESLPTAKHTVQLLHTVPGRLRYDQTKHVDVKAPMDGILTELLVTPGDVVEVGQLLAVIRSPEIGQARAEILKRKAQLGIAQKVLQREQTLSKNLGQLFVLLDQGKTADEIDIAFKDHSLGSFRQEILSAYTKMLLADELITKTRPLAASGSISGRLIRERENERQLAQTEFRTARDQAKFAADQAKLKAEEDVAEADRQLNLAWQSVETLLGYKENKETANLSNEEALSRLEIRAPFVGTVESRAYADNERVTRGDSLLVLANTDSLFVEASIRERDWSTVSLKPGTSMKVTVPALEDRIFDAKLLYFGREVQADTNSVPLVALIENHEGLLRPGMFVRVTVPVGSSRESLSVRPESVIQHENQQFVFLDMQGGTFKRVNVSTGQASEEWVEVTDGLALGDLVVTNGAFLLKSELLLQGEGE